MTGYECFVLYLAIKTHFSKPSYDFFKFNGKLRTSKENFDKRNDKYFFIKLSRNYNQKNFVEFLVANFIKDNYWVGDLKEQGEKNYFAWKSKIESLSYNFKQEIQIAIEDVDNFNTLFECKNNQHPLILKYYLSNQISLETLCLLNNKLYFTNQFDKSISETLIWPNLKLKINKYTPFIPHNQEKINKILRDCVLDRFAEAS